MARTVAIVAIANTTAAMAGGIVGVRAGGEGARD